MAFNYEVTNLRFGEFDLGGVLYHANYFHVYEMAREAFLKEGPLPYSKLVDEKCHLAVVETRQRFLQPIYYGEEFTVELTASEVLRSSVTLEYKIFEEHVVHLGMTKLVFVKASGENFSVAQLPAELKSHFEAQLTKSHFNE